MLKRRCLPRCGSGWIVESPGSAWTPFRLCLKILSAERAGIEEDAVGWQLHLGPARSARRVETPEDNDGQLSRSTRTHRRAAGADDGWARPLVRRSRA